MPKTNDATGATYAGYTGIVEHAGGAASTRQPAGLSELDPEKKLDGTLHEGEHPDHPDAKAGEGDLKRELDGTVRADANDVHPIERSTGNAGQEEHPADAAKRSEEVGNTDQSGGEESSPGDSSKTSSSSKPTASATTTASSG